MHRARYPAARRLDLVETLHGHPVADPYRWLEDASSEETMAWSREQDSLFAAERATWPGLGPVATRLRQLLAAGLVTPPAWRGDRQFFLRRRDGQEHPVLLTVDPDGTERLLVDPAALDPSGMTTLDAWQPSKEGHLLGYQLSHGGTEESVLHVIDVASGEPVDGPIDRARYSPVAWLPGGRSFYYVRRLPPEGLPPGEEQYHRRVWWHEVGSDPADDVLVFGDGRDVTSYYGAHVSMDGRWLVVTAAAGTAPRNDVWLADLEATGPRAPRLVDVQVGLDASTSAMVGRDGRLYVFTEHDAPRGRLAVADPAAPGPDQWRDLLPEDPVAVLEGYAVLDGAGLDRSCLLASWTRHAVSELTVHDLETGERTGAVELPGVGTVGGISERPEGGHEAWFAYTDHTHPIGVQHFDARTGEVRLWAAAPGTVDVPDVTARQVTLASRDGTPVRMFVVARTDSLDRSGDDARPREPRPAILTGYGGFGVSLTPGFSATALAWVEAGGVYAEANLRGGGEEGESWHRAGMLATKQNVFDDFHAAAEELTADGWTTPSQLAITGGSNGGLLVGAALTQRPELFSAVVCSAPLLDMVRYEQFGLGQTWNEEYGTAADPEQLAWLLAYSPYHHVRDRPAGVGYPAVLFTVFDSDTRVDPMHARKMCAALQHVAAGQPESKPVLYRREADVGHGARAVSRSVLLSADMLAFVAAHVGLALGTGDVHAA